MATQKSALPVPPSVEPTDIPDQPWNRPPGQTPGLPLHPPKEPEPSAASQGADEAGSTSEEAGGSQETAGGEAFEEERRRNRAREDATSTAADRAGERARE